MNLLLKGTTQIALFDLLNKNLKTASTKNEIILCREDDTHYNFYYRTDNSYTFYKNLFSCEYSTEEEKDNDTYNKYLKIYESICFKENSLFFILQLLATDTLDIITIKGDCDSYETLNVKMLKKDGTEIDTIATTEKVKANVETNFSNIENKFNSFSPIFDISNLTKSNILSQLLNNYKFMLYIMKMPTNGNLMAVVNDSDTLLLGYDLEDGLINVDDDYKYLIRLNKSIGSFLLNKSFTGSKSLAVVNNISILKYDNNDDVICYFQYLDDDEHIITDDIYNLYTNILEYSSNKEIDICEDNDDLDSLTKIVRDINYNFLDRKLVWNNDSLEMLSMDTKTNITKKVPMNIGNHIIVNYDDFLNLLTILNFIKASLNTPLKQSKKDKDKAIQEIKHIDMDIDLSSSAGIYFNSCFKDENKIVAILTNLNVD